MSDPSFKRSRGEEYYALYFEAKMLQGGVNNRDYKHIFHRFIKYFSKVFL